MAGIYLHIPYCKQKCSYCNFHFSTNLINKNSMVEAMIKELELRKNELINQTVETIYFGGGTPTLLTISEIKSLLEKIKQLFKVENEVEITLEANPDDLNEVFLTEIYDLGINRLSIGIQSFFEEDLKLMNRIHSSKEAENCVILAQKVGFKNISIDLIYGIQTSNFENWKINVQKAIDLNVSHISSYALTIEEKTELYSKIKAGKIASINEDEQFIQFDYLQKTLLKNGFNHYEISNFGKENFYSKHNTSYWKGKTYLGIGASAHSFDGIKTRKWNVSNNSMYLKKIQNDENAFESEILSENEQFNELIMIGLRTEFGINLSILESKFPESIQQQFKKKLENLKHFNYFEIEKNHLLLKKEFWFLSDGIASDFFLV